MVTKNTTLQSCWFFLFLCVLLCRGTSLSSLEINALSGLMLFDSDIEHFQDVAADASSTLNFIENLSINQRYSDSLSFDIILDHDPVLLNRALVRMGFHSPFFSVQVGPFVGLFNTSVILNPGLSLIATGNIASFIFASFQFDTTFSAGINQPGDYAQNCVDLKAGFRFPFSLAVVFNLNTKTYTKKQENGAVFASERIRYAFSLERAERLWIFSRIQATGGYQELGWKGTLIDKHSVYKHCSVYGELEMEIQIGSSFNLYLGGAVPIYSWTKGESAERMMFYEMSLGGKWKFVPVAQDR